MNIDIDKQVKVSVIVPVYNVEKILERCIDSIIKQSFTDIEILLIDDGSIDDSKKICCKFKKIDNRIRVYTQENKGVSAARNIGIRNAKGKYIIFVDSDDYIEENYIENLIRNESDFTICGITVQDEKYNELYVLEYCPRKSIAVEEIDFLYYLKETDFFSPCCKLFRADIIKKHDIEFPLGTNWGEDAVFVAEYVNYIQTSNIIESRGYYYIKYSSSNTLSTNIRESIIDEIVNSRSRALSTMKFLDEAQYEDAAIFFENNIKKNCAYFIKILLNNERISIYRKIKMLSLYMKNSYTRKTMKDKSLFPSIMSRCFKVYNATIIVISYRMRLIRRNMKNRKGEVNASN